MFGTSGSNGVRMAGFQVADSAPSVRPWNPWVSAMMRAGLPPISGAAPGSVRPVQLGELQGRLVAFGARIAEVHVRALRCAGQLDQTRGQLDLRLGGEVVAGVRHLGGLGADGLDPSGMGVAERVDGDARQEVKVFVAVHIPDAGALPVVHHTQRRAEHVHVHARVLAQPLAALGAERFDGLRFICHRNSSFPRRLPAPPSYRYRRW